MQVTATIGRTNRLGAGIATAALMMTLAACGGGGGSGSSTSAAVPPASTAPITPANPPPIDPPPANPSPTNPPPTSSTAELTWTAPTQNEDGTALTNLGGYKVRYGQTPGTLTEVRDIANSATTSVTIEGLSSDMSYFTLASYTNAGVESAPTGAFSKTII